MLDFKEYERVFNEGDDVALVERFFHEDVVFVMSGRVIRGKQDLLEFLRWAHDGVLERMRPQTVLHEGDQTFAEIDMDFHAVKPRADFPFGAVQPGDTLTVKFFVLYKSSGGKVSEAKAMTWAPGREVSRLPRLGAHPSQVGAFRAYLSAFSNADYARFSAFYNDDVTLQLGEAPPLRGKQAIVDFYQKMFPSVRENLTVLKIEATDETIELEAVARFTALEDAPTFSVAPLRKGEAVEIAVGVSYLLRGGLAQTIKTRRLGGVQKVGH